jgi:hypothetical protein
MSVWTSCKLTNRQEPVGEGCCRHLHGTDAEVLLADCPSLEMVRMQVSPRHSHLSTKLYCVTPHKTVTFPVFALWVSNVKMCVTTFSSYRQDVWSNKWFSVFWNKSIIVPSVAHFMCIALDIRSLLCPSYETWTLHIFSFWSEYRKRKEGASSPKPSRPALGLIRPFYLWTLGLFSADKAAGAWSCKLNTIAVVKNKRRYMSAAPIYLDGVEKFTLVLYSVLV